MKTEQVKALLRQRFSAPTHAIFFEVSDATGFAGTGWADAISMSLWPSHGLTLEGYEIKISRGDWKRELANPVKAEKFAARCDKWWIVTAEGVIQDDAEIPSNWGWILASNDGLAIKRQAIKNVNPVLVDRVFLAALLRGAGKADAVAIEAICQERLKELRRTDEQNIQHRVQQATGRRSDDTKILDIVRERLGEDANYIEIQNMADSIVAVYKSGIAETWRGLRTVVSLLEDTSAKVRKCHADLRLPKIEKRKRYG
jgi:hypothetical protein